MKVIAAGAFKAQCLAIMDEVRARKIKVIITKNGKLVAQLVPMEEEQDGLFGFYAGRLVISGDIEYSSVPAGHWSHDEGRPLVPGLGKPVRIT